MFFRPADARWNSERSVVEFGVGVGEYESMVRASRRVFQILLPEAPTSERCLEAYHLHRTRLELIAERKVRRRQLTDDGNIEITSRDSNHRYREGTGVRVAGSSQFVCASGGVVVNENRREGPMVRIRLPPAKSSMRTRCRRLPRSRLCDHALH